MKRDFLFGSPSVKFIIDGSEIKNPLNKNVWLEEYKIRSERKKQQDKQFPTTTTTTIAPITTTTTTLPPITNFTIINGLLYNWYAATDARKLTSSDTWRVTESTDWKALLLALGGIDYVSIVRSEDPNEFGDFPLHNHYPLCDTNTDYWTTFTGTNTLNFNFRGSGIRSVDYDSENDIVSVSYMALGSYGFCVNTDVSYNKELVFFIRNLYALAWMAYDYIEYITKKSGYSIRLVRPATEDELLLANGTACDDYIGNNGQSHRTVKLFNLVWLADNLSETKFRNGDYIHGFENGIFTPILDEDWGALTSAGVSAYNNNLALAWDNSPI